jgi:F-type H+-transporting ATPase subunit gamma
LLVIGQKGISIAKTHKNASYFSIKTLLDGNQIEEIVSSIKTKYFVNDLRVNVIYTKFINQITFETEIKKLLPIDQEEIKKMVTKNSIGPQIYFEPNREELANQVIDLYLHAMIVYFYRESKASEESSRRVAMDAATSNGKELLEKLEIEFNRTRQAKITQEILEIIGGAESLK